MVFTFASRIALNQFIRLTLTLAHRPSPIAHYPLPDTRVTISFAIIPFIRLLSKLEIPTTENKIICLSCSTYCHMIFFSVAVSLLLFAQNYAFPQHQSFIHAGNEVDNKNINFISSAACVYAR